MKAQKEASPGAPREIVPGRVTVAVPVYRRMHYLSRVLGSVAGQEHPDLEILISDNGQNGPELEEAIDRHLERPYRLRRNPETVDITDHYNQLVREASGEYFVLLADDDELGEGFVPRLSGVLGSEPEVGVALASLEVMDEEGETVDRERGGTPPARMSGTEFVRIWCRGEHDFVCFCTTMARTAEIRRAGGYPVFPRGTSVDNALLLKLCLGRRVAFLEDVTFRYRVYEESHGLALGYRDLARDLRAFLEWLDADPDLARFAREHPDRWREVRDLLIEITWRTYRQRWKTMYQKRLSRLEWIRAAFAMPFLPAYYREVLRVLAKKAARTTLRLGRG